MTPQELRAHAMAFLGHMLTKPEVLADVQNVPQVGPGPAKDAAAMGAVIAKHLNIAQPTDDEVRQIAKHVQDATAGVKDALREHSPTHAEAFSPSHFMIM